MKLETARGRSRQGVLWKLLDDCLATLAPADGRPVTVLDCGGGSGAFAVPLASRGAHVTVVDLSADSLATLERRAAEQGVAGAISAVQGDVESLASVIEDKTFDLVLAHDVLSELDDLAGAFAGVAAAVRPGGLLSALVANPAAAVLARALAGDIAAALHEFGSLTTSFTNVGPDTFRALARDAGLVIDGVHGIGVFTEFVPGKALETAGAREALAELEARASARPPFTDIAGRVHVLARRPS